MINKGAKSIIFIFAALLLLTPLASQAFSWHWWWQDDSEPVVSTPAQLTMMQKNQVQVKYDAWNNAWQKKDISLLLQQPENLQWSGEELNYIITQAIADDENIPVHDVQIALADREVTITGTILKPLSGDFELVVRPVSLGSELYFYVAKVRFKGFYFPKFIASRLLDSYLEPVLQWLYTAPNYDTIDLLSSDDGLSLSYTYQ
ncbi:MAG: hypothetical protein ACKKL5_01250 [Candidatus Komeilibacteria bacterium]